jgi:hypothetical protein
MEGRMVSETDKAYIAGLVDGEGCVRIWKVGSPRQLDKMNRKTPIYNPWLSIANNNVEVLRWIQSLYGGRLQPHNRTRPVQAWVLVLTSRAAERILKDIVPYLRIKKPQTEVVLGYYQENMELYGCKGVPEEEVSRREELYQRALAVNPGSHQHRLSENPPVLQ